MSDETFLILTFVSQKEKCQSRGQVENFVSLLPNNLRSENQNLCKGSSVKSNDYCRTIAAVCRPLIFDVHCPSLPWPFRLEVWLPISDCCLSKSDQDK